MRRRAESWRLYVALGPSIIEAALYLVMARLAIRALPFERLAWFLTLAPRQPEITGAKRKRVLNEVQRAIEATVCRLPGQTTCFSRAVAAQAMLRRRGVGATLYYGAATSPERGLAAHVWLQDGEEGVVGHQAAQQYRILARYPVQP